MIVWWGKLCIRQVCVSYPNPTSQRIMDMFAVQGARNAPASDQRKLLILDRQSNATAHTLSWLSP
jgi:hypothetical protein